VDYAVIRNFLFTNQLSAVNHGKKSVVDNIGPRDQLFTSSIALFAEIYSGFFGTKVWQMALGKCY
jgi:hypothetical protein